MNINVCTVLQYVISSFMRAFGRGAVHILGSADVAALLSFMSACGRGAVHILGYDAFVALLSFMGACGRGAVHIHIRIC